MSLRRDLRCYAEHEALGAKLVDFGGWEMPLAYPDGTIAEHLACRERRGRLRRQPSRHRPGRGPGRLRPAADEPDQRPAPDRARARPVPAPARRGRRLGARRPASSGGSPRSRFDVMPNASNTERVIAVLGGRGRHRATRAVIAVQGPRARERLATVAPEAAAVGHFAVARLRVRRRDRAASPAPATPVRTASSAPSRPRWRRPFWRAVVAAGVQPGRARRPRHPAPRSRPAPARPRARAGHHPAAGRPRLGGQLGQGPLPGPGGARGERAPGRGGACGACSPRAAGRLAPATPSSSAARRRAWSRAATSRPCCSGASPSPSCLPRSPIGRRGRDRRPRRRDAGRRREAAVPTACAGFAAVAPTREAAG